MPKSVGEASGDRARGALLPAASASFSLECDWPAKSESRAKRFAIRSSNKEALQRTVKPLQAIKKRHKDLEIYSPVKICSWAQSQIATHSVFKIGRRQEVIMQIKGVRQGISLNE